MRDGMSIGSLSLVMCDEPRDGISHGICSDNGGKLKSLFLGVASDSASKNSPDSFVAKASDGCSSDIGTRFSLAIMLRNDYVC